MSVIRSSMSLPHGQCSACGETLSSNCILPSSFCVGRRHSDDEIAHAEIRGQKDNAIATSKLYACIRRLNE
jgi:hypothetical protein